MREETCWALFNMRYFAIVRPVLVAAATICSLLWAVTGVSVLAVALHEHHHHGETHEHHDAIEVALHGHPHEGSHDHAHQLTAPLSASRSIWFGHSHVMDSDASDLDDSEIGPGGSSIEGQSEPRDLGPPAYLMHCVLLT